MSKSYSFFSIKSNLYLLINQIYPSLGRGGAQPPWFVTGYRVRRRIVQDEGFDGSSGKKDVAILLANNCRLQVVYEIVDDFGRLRASGILAVYLLQYACDIWTNQCVF